MVGEATTTSWPPWRRMGTVFEPIRPVPPITTIFIPNLLVRSPQAGVRSWSSFQLAWTAKRCHCPGTPFSSWRTPTGRRPRRAPSRERKRHKRGSRTRRAATSAGRGRRSSRTRARGGHHRVIPHLPDTARMTAESSATWGRGCAGDSRDSARTRRVRAGVRREEKPSREKPPAPAQDRRPPARRSAAART